MQRKLVLAFGCILAAALLTGCPTMRFGRVPPTVRLTTDLTPHVSTKADVLRVLGPPRGYGRAQLRSIAAVQDTWFYEALSSDMAGDVKMKFLLVYFDGEIFDGYFWFSSLEGAPPILQR